MRTSADWRWIDADCAVARPPRPPFEIAQTCEVWRMSVPSSAPVPGKRGFLGICANCNCPVQPDRT